MSPTDQPDALGVPAELRVASCRFSKIAPVILPKLSPLHNKVNAVIQAVV